MNSTVMTSSNTGISGAEKRSAMRSSSRVLGAVLAVSLIAFICVGSAEGFVTGSRPVSKRSFFDIQCKGVFDKSIFARLDRICDDCYNLYREPQLHSLCSENCFSTTTFIGCLDALQLSDQWDSYRKLITTLHADTRIITHTPNHHQNRTQRHKPMTLRIHRSNCFGSPYFKGCLDALLLNDDEAKYEEMIEILGKKK